MIAPDKLHSLLPVFYWSWWQVFFTVLLLDWGIFHILKWLDPPHKKSPHWLTNMYGDIFLPIGIASSIVVVRQFEHSNAWYVSNLVNWSILVLGLAIIIFLEFGMEYKIKHKKNKFQVTSPSAIWHAIVFVPLFYLAVISLIPIFVTHKPTWAFILALLGYVAWLTALLHDIKWHPADNHKKTPLEVIRAIIRE